MVDVLEEMTDQTEYEDRRFWEETDFEKIMKIARAEALIYGYSLIEFMTPAHAIILASKMQEKDEIKKEADSFVKGLISNVHNLRKFNPNGYPDLSNLNDNFPDE